MIVLGSDLAGDDAGDDALAGKLEAAFVDDAARGGIGYAAGGAQHVDSRQVPVFGSPAVQVATSALEVMITGRSALPMTKIWAPRETARLPPMLVVLAITVPGSMVSVAPRVTKICFCRL